MADKDKKPSYLIWILIAAGILVLVIGIGFYMLWRKSSASEVKAAVVNKTVEDVRVKIAQLEETIKTKDEKIQELTRDVGNLKEKNTELSYQIKEMKTSGYGNNSRNNGSFSSNRDKQIGSSKTQKKQINCDDNGCHDQVDDLE